MSKNNKVKKPQYNFIPMFQLRFSIRDCMARRIQELEQENRSLQKLCNTYDRFIANRDRIIKRLKKKGK